VALIWFSLAQGCSLDRLSAQPLAKSLGRLLSVLNLAESIGQVGESLTIGRSQVRR
jgi:hypothetical protein